MGVHIYFYIYFSNNGLGGVNKSRELFDAMRVAGCAVLVLLENDGKPHMLDDQVGNLRYLGGNAE